MNLIFKYIQVMYLVFSIQIQFMYLQIFLRFRHNRIEYDNEYSVLYTLQCSSYSIISTFLKVTTEYVPF